MTRQQQSDRRKTILQMLKARTSAGDVASKMNVSGALVRLVAKQAGLVAEIHFNEFGKRSTFYKPQDAQGGASSGRRQMTRP